MLWVGYCFAIIIATAWYFSKPWCPQCRSRFSTYTGYYGVGKHVCEWCGYAWW